MPIYQEVKSKKVTIINFFKKKIFEIFDNKKLNGCVEKVLGQLGATKMVTCTLVQQGRK